MSVAVITIAHLMSVAVIAYDQRMGRWEPNARGRLEQAALELYVERGFEQTTVAEIAERAGLTERTFFRHFADKREVLFAGSGVLQELLVTAVADAPDSAAPIESGHDSCTINRRKNQQDRPTQSHRETRPPRRWWSWLD